MKLSIIIAVLDSHDVVNRQLKHFSKMSLEDVEILIIDDGSNPPLMTEIDFVYNDYIRFYETKDIRPWSQPCARNTGALVSESSRLLMTDIDHILSKECIEFCKNSDEDKVVFPRFWGVLDCDGDISQETSILFDFGLSKELYDERGLHAGHHANTFMIKKSVYNMLGGYDEKFCGKYGGDDTDFSRRYSHLCRVEKKCKPHVMGPAIYVYPDPRKDVKKIFHRLRYK